MSPDIFLSRQGLRYDGSGLAGTPTQICQRLITLNEARHAGTYQTKNFIPAPVTAATFDPQNVAREQQLFTYYLESLQTGVPAKVHKAVDAVNRIRQVKSGGELIPPSEFDILAHQQTPLGAAARWLISEADSAAAVFYTSAFTLAIRKFAKEQQKG